MSKIIVAVDAMGSDNAVEVEVKGALQAIAENDDIHIRLFGDESQINKYLDSHERLSVVHCEEVIDINKEPVMQIRSKKNSSMVKALKAVKAGECDCFVSAGSTGGVVAGGLLIVGRVKGIKRPALCPVIPSLETKVLLDVGANDETKAEYIFQNALMGAEYTKLMNVDNPKVALLNIGAEAKKGTPIYQEVFKMLSEDNSINFIGNIEGRDIFTTDANVIVTDGFSGNIALKTMEGTAKLMGGIIKSVLTKNFKNKIAAAVVSNDLKESFSIFDYQKVGGSILLGCKNVVVKAHGSSTEYSFKQAILLAYKLEKDKIASKIEQVL